MKLCNKCQIKMFDGVKNCGVCGSDDLKQLTPIIKPDDFPTNEELIRQHSTPIKPKRIDCKHGHHELRPVKSNGDYACCVICNEFVRTRRYSY